MSAPAAVVMCRDCAAVRPLAEGAACAACGSRRLLRHPELLELSVAHVDCDAFYASVEKRDRPELLPLPVVVGGGRRGVVTSACYIARTTGVRSAMPMFKALRLCPDAVVVRPDMAKYVAAARRIRALMGRLTPLVQPLSIDEAVLDLSGTAALHRAPPAAVLARFALEVEREVGVTVSVGLAPNRLLAKIAAERDKPRGFAVIGAAEAASLLAPEPVTLLPGRRAGDGAAAGGGGLHPARPARGAVAARGRAALRRGRAGAGGARPRRGCAPGGAGAGNAQHQRRDHLRRRPLLGGGAGTAALADVREAVAATWRRRTSPPGAWC